MAKKIVAVDMYNPHADIDDKKKGQPGPGAYHVGT